MSADFIKFVLLLVDLYPNPDVRYQVTDYGYWNADQEVYVELRFWVDHLNYFLVWANYDGLYGIKRVCMAGGPRITIYLDPADLPF